MVNVPWLEGTFNDMYTQYVCVLLPPLPNNRFPSIQGIIISLLKYQTLGIIQDRKRN
jgi:hypothetical protein